MRRLFWIGMVLLHSVGLYLAWGRFGDNGSASIEVIGLSLSLAFFVLKVVDVRFLRLNPGWRSFVAASVIVALLHVNVLNRIADNGALAPVADISWAQVVGAALVVELARRVAKHLRAGVGSAQPAALKQLAVAFVGRTVGDASGLPDCLAIVGPRTLRGPPTL